MIELDKYSLLLQIGIFLVLWMVLKRWWFEPTLKIIHERHRRSEGAVAEARAIQIEVEKLQGEQAAMLEAARSTAQHEVQEMMRAAETEQKRLIDAARDEAGRSLAQVRAQIGDEVASARKMLAEQVDELAREAARRVLGRAI